MAIFQSIEYIKVDIVSGNLLQLEGKFNVTILEAQRGEPQLHQSDVNSKSFTGGRISYWRPTTISDLS